MQVPLQISFEHVDHSAAVEAAVRAEMDKLEQFSERITSARVVVCRPQHRHHTGDVYQVRIHLAVPRGADVVVNREPGVTDVHQDAILAVRDAFAVARRQLQDFVREGEPNSQSKATKEYRS